MHSHTSCSDSGRKPEYLVSDVQPSCCKAGMLTSTHFNPRINCLLMQNSPYMKTGIFSSRATKCQASAVFCNHYYSLNKE